MLSTVSSNRTRIGLIEPSSRRGLSSFGRRTEQSWKFFAITHVWQMYQTTAHQAFNFCRVYTRKTEFRRLCDLLRNHLQNVAKYSNQPHSINLNDPETLQRHLDTRFSQLNVAADLELGRRLSVPSRTYIVLISMSKRPPKAVRPDSSHDVRS
jgi:hypothetical protein